MSPDFLRDKFPFTIEREELVSYNHPDYRINDYTIEKLNNMSNFELFVDTVDGQSEQEKIKAKFLDHKLIIIRPAQEAFSKLEVLKLKSIFGVIMKQNFSDHSSEYFSIFNSDRESRIIAKSNRTQALHTDNGFASNDRVPTTVALHCEKQSTNGGYSQIVPAKKIIDFLHNSDREIIDHLATESAITFVKMKSVDVFENPTVYSKSLIKILGESQFELDFSPFADRIIAKSEKSLLGYRLIWNFSHDITNQWIFKLPENSILVFRNKNYLHGRTGFPQDERRILNRVWFKD